MLVRPTFECYSSKFSHRVGFKTLPYERSHLPSNFVLQTHNPVVEVARNHLNKRASSNGFGGVLKDFLPHPYYSVSYY